MRILVVGAGVIGRVHACLLAEAGHEVTMLARGSTAEQLAREGITITDGVRTRTRPVRIIEEIDSEAYDLALIAVRRDQRDGVLGLLDRIDSAVLVPMFNSPLGLGPLREQFGASRIVGAFPGVGGYLAADGAVRYARIRQQPTTIERKDGGESTVVQAFSDAGCAISVVDDMDGWLATHAVFVVAICAALERAGYSIEHLTGSREALRTMVRAVRDGFTALGNSGITVSPAGLRFIFTAAPIPAAAWYWRRALRGPLGTVAIAPHARATRDTETAALRVDLDALLPSGSAGDFDRLVRPDAPGLPPGVR
ncbi:ketopantoate reductase family protein [Nocardia sp. NBC_01327]|uniref:ketopantoate reductase family protein n=1 Tax=Nocardia sp. NBC_01327 TaxID=2903593 RepID=UPI002E0D72E7|nr:hypothetical protein OG326_20860 [Nocardia sp. NBC_01327]